MIKLIVRYAAALAIATVVYAQSAARPEFEVASVKANDPTNAQASYMPTLDVRPGGTLQISNRRLDEIIMVAYGISGTQIAGPRWLTELTTDPSQVTKNARKFATEEQIARAARNLPWGPVRWMAS